MGNSNFEKLKEFIVDQIGVHEDDVTPQSRLYDDLGVYGDDACEMLIAYSRRFNVDVSKFMAADYFKGEGVDLIGGLRWFFTGKRSGHNYKVLTINDLENGINAGRLDEEVIARANNTPEPVEWLLLRIIDEQPSWGNDYNLERFMAKTDLCLSFYEDLRGLVKKEWLGIQDPKAQLKKYYTTSEGKRLLAEGYKTADIKDFVLAIEPTGFIVRILERIDERYSDPASEGGDDGHWPGG